MARLYTACWAMSDTALGASGVTQRVSDLRSAAIQADTYLKIEGRAGTGAFTRMLIVPEYYFSAGTAVTGTTATAIGPGLGSRDDKHQIYKELEGISAQVPELIIVAGTIAYGKGKAGKEKTYSVCPVLRNGSIVKKLYKTDDDGVYKINGKFSTKTDHGKAVPLFTLDGISIGIDICMDYGEKRLKKYLDENNLGRPDVHVHISGSNMTQQRQTQAKVGGIYIHCDLGGYGAKAATAWHVSNHDQVQLAATAGITPSAVYQQGSGSLSIFDTSF